MSHAVWLYHRFGVRFRDAADLLAQHGLTVSDDAIRLWCLDFDSADARRLTRRQGRLGDIWHRDKVFVRYCQRSLETASNCTPVVSLTTVMPLRSSSCCSS